MFSQINHWMEYTATAFDVVLLLRVLALRLQRMYTFLTLACALAVIFDAATIFYAVDNDRVSLYANLFSAFIFPLAAWDVFEEIAKPAATLRRMAILRTLASMVIIFFFGLLWTASISDTDDPTYLGHIQLFTFVFTTGSAAACLAFLWIMRRGLLAQKITLPRNTSVWMTFFALLMIEQLASWMTLLIFEALGKPAQDNFSTISNSVLNAYGIVITIWCAVKLRGLPKDIPSVSVNENS